MPKLKLTLTVFITLIISACTGLPDRAQVVDGFNIERYLGTWYEIARLDHPFERGLDNIKATYSTNPDGSIRVLNQGYNQEEEEWSEAEGKAYFVDDPEHGHLKVSFFGPFYSTYAILELDADYRYAMISGPNTDYLWLLSREISMPEEIKTAYLEKAKELGFDITALIYPSHTLTE